MIRNGGCLELFDRASFIIQQNLNESPTTIAPRHEIKHNEVKPKSNLIRESELSSTGGLVEQLSDSSQANFFLLKET